MLRILICCGGGFSSSALAGKVDRDIKAGGIEEEVSISFSPFSIAHERATEFDVIMCCPHLKFAVNSLAKNKIQNDVPIYILPPRMYGTMELNEVIQDAKDVILKFKQTPQNPISFKGEENIMKVTRSKAYRNHYKLTELTI